MSKLTDVISNPTFDNLKSYVYTQCSNPVRVVYTDKATGETVNRLVPCGKCVHCRASYQNEWVTRLTHHAIDYPFVYFITLTYSSVEPSMQRLLYGTYPELSYNNSRGTREYRPSLINKEHFQKFMKRLRYRFPGVSLTYYACFEYGERYLRPHIHLILFSHVRLLKSDIVRAWSYDVVMGSDGFYRARHGFDKSYETVSIGRVDMADLRENGTLSNKSADSMHCAKFAFKYVCKYVGKSSLSPRLYKYLKDKFNSINQPFYEQTKQILKSIEGLDYSWDSETIQNKWYIIDHLQPSFDCFLRKFAPCHVCSLKTPIGSAYASSNVERFARGDFKLEKVNGENLVFPKYYLRKAKDKLCPFVSVNRFTGSQKRFVAESLPLFLRTACLIRNARFHLSDYTKDFTDSAWHYLFSECSIIYDREQHLRYVFNDYTFAYDVQCYNKLTHCYDTFPYSLSFEDMISLVESPTKDFIDFNLLLLSRQLVLVLEKDKLFELFPDFKSQFIDIWNDINKSFELSQSLYNSKHVLS